MDYLAFKLQVDVAIVEVGLGGKFDATNVVWDYGLCYPETLELCDLW